MKRVVGLVAGVAMLSAGLVTGPDGARAVPVPGPMRGPMRGIAWGPCAQPGQAGALGGVLRPLGSQPARSRTFTAATAGMAPVAAPGRAPVGNPVECATVRVPLDYREPLGQQITLALNRIRGTANPDGNHLGALLVNPGGPGGSGRGLAQYVAAALPRDVAARFDVIGFDPRGVGASEPSISCVDPKRFYAPPRLDNVPRGKADEDALIDRARQYAESCGNRWAWFLPYLTTENAARDMDAIRAALGEEKISYLGYSYGTYLGAVYATLFPQRVRRLVLDSVVDPEGVWYDANIAQDYAFDRRHKDFLAWVSRYDRVFHLGQTPAAASFAWYSMRSRLREKPAGGIVGPSELDDIYTTGGYSDRVWPRLAQAFSDYVLKGDTAGLVALFHGQAEIDAKEENNYAVYLGVQCRDAAWPRSWARWHADTERVQAEAPFMAWPNAVYNAPCAFWPERGGTPVKVGTAQLPPILLIQSQHDAATPYPGALHMRRLFPTARMISEDGGNHGVSLAGNPCVDRHLAAYLRDATLLPQRRAMRRADATCPAQPEPRPLVSRKARMSGPGSAGPLLGGPLFAGVLLVGQLSRGPLSVVR
ncbi:alpha/beta hydrolase [Planotetraspora sp. GP83]|uniref:alpha/beta hydrolase n=1 Tax=Planotetraspora sp. GP83 TaxID=3156264 RepID=UPI003513AF24